MVGRDEQVNNMRARINTALENRNNIMQNQNDDLAAALTELKEARKLLKITTKRWEEEYWNEIIEDCREAGETNNSSKMYSSLKKLGQRGLTKASNNTKLTKEDFKTHFEKISKHRFENDPTEIEEMLSKVDDIRETEAARNWNDTLNMIPSNEEIFEQMDKMRESAPGEDNVRLIYIKQAVPEIKESIGDLVRYMFRNDAADWEDSLKIGLVIPLFKKGDKDDENNY